MGLTFIVLFRKPQKKIQNLKSIIISEIESYYLKVVPSFKKNEGAIEFSLNGSQYYDAKSPKVVYSPKAGDIVLFPSSLHHRTIPFSTDTDRISIAFDLIPNLKKEL